jgi:CheY-like chemotaxis protein
MDILLVEDDDVLARWLVKQLSSEPWLKDARWEWIATESEFRSRFEQIAKNPPDIVILDVILPWSGVRPNTQAPKKVINKESIAGLRCQRRLAKDKRTGELIRASGVLQKLMKQEAQSYERPAPFSARSS